MSGGARLALGLFASALLIDLVLIQPNHPAALGWGALRLVPLELPVLLLGLLALGRRATGLALVAALALLVMVLVKLADFGVYTAFARSYDPVADLHLLPAGLHLLSGSIGVLGTALLGALLVLALAAVAWLLFLALALWARTGSRLSRPARLAAGIVALVFAGLSAAEIRTALNGWQGWNPPGAAFTSRLAAEHLRDFRRARTALTAFRLASRTDPWDGQGGLLAQLGGRDVVIVFVESYGRAAYDNPLYAARHAETLASGEAALRQAGLEARSGWLRSPVMGGQSWLAHASLVSGLDVSDQTRYRALLTSDRKTLFTLARQAGYQSVAVAPAIVMPWPEGPQLGFETVLAAADLGYAGLPYNWVTMPDQYTLSAYDRLAPPGAPRLTEIALISSHAPWTPVAEMVPWDAVGDGSVFDAQAVAGPSPGEVWADRDSIRDQYGRALDYSIETVLSWAALPRERQPLLIVLGDHQAAGFVSQHGGMDVPVHLIGPPEAVALFEGWGWSSGLTPDPALQSWPMSAFRDRFLEATSRETEGGS
ncbi:sulfatase-like hydrolase/transferase [Salipiger bermudensis]|uniref:sulfatase-like hydrolase/transferase n=1 Tax=Salipiger bermudensis TaxID=344736 RepID=UPI001CD34B84|nr:sulfatase-like hydrolase/transferase [Salipiger bermudensis]MCA0963930.1 sulfatase-like hydrolase/transferase [Salipiger bermudensis]